MDALRRYLSHYCRCDDETIARHVAAEEAGAPLRLPDLAYAVTTDFRLLQAAVHVGEALVQERAERAAMAKAAPKTASAPAAPPRAKVLEPKHKPGSAAAKRYAEIMSYWPAQLRPERATQLAADPAISINGAHRLLFASLTPAEVHAHNAATAPTGVDYGVWRGGDPNAYEPPPEREQYEAAVKANHAVQGPTTVRIHG